MFVNIKMFLRENKNYLLTLYLNSILQSIGVKIKYKLRNKELDSKKKLIPQFHGFNMRFQYL